MDAAELVDRSLALLSGETVRTAPGSWALTVECAGHPLVLELTLRGMFLRAEAAVLPSGLIDPGQLLFWNGQAPLVCFAQSSAGEVLVCGEIPVAGLEAELLDRFLGLVHASATRARQFVLPAA